MKFTKKTFYIRTKKYAEPVDGYRFELAGHELYVYKNPVFANTDVAWSVTDPATGLSIASGTTRDKAVKSAEDRLGRYEEVLATAKYADMARDFENKLTEHESVHAGVIAPADNGEEKGTGMIEAEGKTFAITGALERMTKETAGIRLARLGAKLAPNVTKKVDYLVQADCRNGGRRKKELARKYGILVIAEAELYEILERRPAAQASTGVSPQKSETREPDPVPEVAAAVTVETVRELLGGYNVAVTQKNERCQIKVTGDTKPCRELLKENGFRWSRKGFWWRRAAA